MTRRWASIAALLAFVVGRAAVAVGTLTLYATYELRLTNTALRIRHCNYNAFACDGYITTVGSYNWTVVPGTCTRVAWR